MGAVFAGLDVAGEELGLGGDLLHGAGEALAAIEPDFDAGADGPGAEFGCRDVGADPGLGLFEEGDDGAAGGDEIARADGDGFDPDAGGGPHLDFGELRGELGGFGLGLFPAGAGLGELLRAGAEAGHGGGFFGLEGLLFGCFELFGPGAGFEELDPLAEGAGASVERFAAAGGFVERLGRDVAGAGELFEAFGGGVGGF